MIPIHAIEGSVVIFGRLMTWQFVRKVLGTDARRKEAKIQWMLQFAYGTFKMELPGDLFDLS